MEFLEQSDGTCIFRCTACNHEQGRGGNTDLFLGGVRLAA